MIRPMDTEYVYLSTESWALDRYDSNFAPTKTNDNLNYLY
jgi:hypothetical protein